MPTYYNARVLDAQLIFTELSSDAATPPVGYYKTKLEAVRALAQNQKMFLDSMIRRYHDAHAHFNTMLGAFRANGYSCLAETIDGSKEIEYVISSSFHCKDATSQYAYGTNVMVEAEEESDE